MDKKESGRVTREREKADLSKVDPKYIDDYRDRFKERDEERARRNNPSSSAGSWSKGKGSSR